MTRILRHLAIILLAVLCTPVGAAFSADEPSAVVLSVEGSAEAIDAAGLAEPLKKGRRLSNGQAVETGENGRVVLVLNDGSQIEIFEDSRVEVAEVLVEEDKGFSLSIFLGHIHMKIKSLVSSEIVVTPTMVAGVRGTEFLVGVADDGASVLSVSEGLVDVASADEEDSSKELEIPAGSEVLAEETGAGLDQRNRTIESIEDVRKFRRQRLEKFIERLPETAGRMDDGVTRLLNRLEKTGQKLISKAEEIKRQADEFKAVGGAEAMRQGTAEERRTRFREIQKLGLELKALQRLGKSYRMTHARLKTLFLQGARFQKMLPKLENRLGAKYSETSAALAKALARREAAKAGVAEMDRRVREAMQPVRPIMKRFKELKEKEKSGRPIGGGEFKRKP